MVRKGKKLNIEKEYLDDHQVKLTVDVPADRFEAAKRRAARKIARSVKIPGFRPGKAPYDVIVRHVGEAAVIEDGLDLLVTDIYPEIIQESGIKPYSSGTLESVEKLDPPVLIFTVPLEVEVELGDYTSIRREYKIDPTTDEQVNEVIENIREQQAIIEPVDREALPGDVVSVKISGSRVGEAEENEDDTVIKERVISLLINTPDRVEESEWPYVGFSQNLINHKAGDRITLNHTFDDSSPYENLKDLEVQFSIEVESVRSRTLPKLDEEFLSGIGDYETYDKLREEIFESITNHNIEQYNNDYDESILEELISNSEIKYPPQMVESQIDNLVDNLEYNLKDQNLDLDLYLKTRQMTLEDLRSELKPVADSRLTRTLVLMELAESENIIVEPDELQEETVSVINGINSAAESGSKKMTKSEIQNITGNIFASMLVSKAMTRFRDIASGQLIQDENQAGLISTDQEDSSQGESSQVNEVDPHLDNNLEIMSETVHTELEAGIGVSGNGESDNDSSQDDK